MKQQLVLSVIVANYNNAVYLPDCLESIMTQTYQPLEVIVADDASTDGSQEIIRAYEHRYPGMIRSIFSPINHGVARTRHAAIKQAHGEYLTTLDSDDYYYDEHKLAREMTLLFEHQTQTGNPILPYSDVVMVTVDKQIINSLSALHPIKEGLIFQELLLRSCLIPRDFILKTALYFEVGGYDFALTTHEDWDLKLRLARRYPFYYTNAVGTAYRRRPDGLSSAYIMTTNNLWYVFAKHCVHLPDGKRNQVKADFARFMEHRATHFLQMVRQTLCHVAPLRMIQRQSRLLYYRLIFFLLKTRWKIWLKLTT